MDNKDYMNPKQFDLVKDEHCDDYRKDDCYGCIYYDPEDQVCMFDK